MEGLKRLKNWLVAAGELILNRFPLHSPLLETFYFCHQSWSVRYSLTRSQPTYSYQLVLWLLFFLKLKQYHLPGHLSLSGYLLKSQSTLIWLQWMDGSNMDTPSAASMKWDAGSSSMLELTACAKVFIDSRTNSQLLDTYQNILLFK